VTENLTLPFIRYPVEISGFFQISLSKGQIITQNQNIKMSENLTIIYAANSHLSKKASKSYSYVTGTGFA